MNLSIEQIPVRALFLAVALSAVILAAAAIAGSFPLQEVTARISGGLLSLFVEVERRGTVLLLDGIEIAVTEDCAGFNALSVLTPMMLIWAAFNRVSLTLMAALVVPVAIIANTIRVIAITTLALLGDLSLAMGHLHDLSGLATFAVAMGIAMTVGRISHHVNLKDRSHLLKALAILCFGFICAYSLYIYTRSPLDARMIGLLVLSIPLLVSTLRQAASAETPQPLWLAVTTLVGLGGFLLDVQLMWVSAILGAGLLLLSALGASAPRLLALAACLIPALPGLTQFLVWLDPDLAAWLLYLIAGSGLLFAWFISKRQRATQTKAKQAGHPRPRMILAGLATLTLTGYLALMAVTPSLKETPGASGSVLAYTLDGWQGRDLPLLLSEETLFDGAHLTKREYHNDNESVSVLEIRTDSHQHVHPPQYCYASAGWQLDTLSNQGGLSLFSAKGTDSDQLVAYYIEVNGHRFAGNQLLLAKLLAVLTPGEEHWRLIRLATPADDAAQERLIRFTGVLSR